MDKSIKNTTNLKKDKIHSLIQYFVIFFTEICLELYILLLIRKPHQ